MKCDIYMQTWYTKSHSTEAVKNKQAKTSVDLSSSGCRKSFVLVFDVARSFLLNRSDRSHYTFSRWFFLFSQLPHLQCVLSCQGAAIFPSVFILLPLIHPFSSDSLFPKWPPTPAMTLFTKLTRAPAEIGPASGKSTLTSFINWISWPLLSVQRGCGA